VLLEPKEASRLSSSQGYLGCSADIGLTGAALVWYAWLRCSKSPSLGKEANIPMPLRFEWDPAKAEQNLEKHRVSFPEAATEFGDPLLMTYDDPDHSVDEERYITIGHSDAGQLLMVAQTDREDSIRIISARRATRRERQSYEEQH
jgi:uncharacterized DUF497 family protein